MTKLWFKRKRFGWGWTPATWEGWAVTVGYVLILIASSMTIDDNSPAREIFFTFVLPVLLATITLFRICYRKGEKPEWRWFGKKDESH